MNADAVEALLKQAIARAAELRHWPVSTYRLQFHKDFTFRHATRIVPYLAALGITHVYASPYLRARPGSTHGYDVIDHTRLNPEVGTTEDYEAFLAAMVANGLRHILDTVPNHVGVATNDNAWWNDVLEHGPRSRFADYFDIAWTIAARPEMKDKVLVPTLGKPYGQALEAGELQLKFDADAGSFSVDYFDRRFPLAPETYGLILAHRGDSGPLTEMIDEVGKLPADAEGRFACTQAVKARLAALCKSDPAAARKIASAVNDFNGTPGNARSFDALDALLCRQHFRLSDWHVAFDEINYRRFFDVNDLAALKMEKLEVFEAAHAFILPLLAAGKIAGLRIDHPDGLFDPAEYLKQLQRHFFIAVAHTLHTGADWPATKDALLARLKDFNGVAAGPDRWPLYVSVEKILAMDEPLIADWATQGTSGYDFLVQLNGLFVDPAAEKQFDALWNEITGDATPYADLAYRNKRRMLESSLASELHQLTHRLDRLAQRQRHALDFSFTTLQTAVREMVACFGVYRTYVQNDAVTEVDAKHIRAAADKAKAKNPRTVPAVFDYVRDLLLQKSVDTATEQDRRDQRMFAAKFQQLTSPVTAKGIEDTTFYQYNRLLSLNEVGGEPAVFGVPPAKLHAFLADRATHWPDALSTLSTHDTKRSEDVRARLNVLADLPDRWAAAVKTWFDGNANIRQTTTGGPSPSPDEEYLIYQTLLGAWPLDPVAEPDFGERIQAYVLKAIREAKVRTRWGEPDEAHEAAVKAFIDTLLDPKKSPAFHNAFQPLLKSVTHFGILNSLSQTLIKLTAPGVPDTYQGTELWDFSLVDPDNRRPVDYERRERLLRTIDAEDVAGLLAAKEDGRIKLRLTTAALKLRRSHAALFARGTYGALTASGSKAAHVFAFERQLEGRAVIVAVPLRVAALVSTDDGLPRGEDVWADTTLALPAGAWTDVFTGGAVSSDRVADLFSTLPFALLISDDDTAPPTPA